MELRTKARRLQAEHGLDLLIVDYLQLMQATSNSRDANRVQEVSEISRGLKGLARELKVPVMALSQLSRQPEMRESREPRLQRPARVRRHRAGRGPGPVPVARARQARRGERDRRRGRQPAPGQAPQRPHRRSEAVVQEEPDPLPQLRRGTLRRGGLKDEAPGTRERLKHKGAALSSVSASGETPAD